MKKILGVGINDLHTSSRRIYDGYTVCPVYSRWYSMINRCYGPKSKLKNSPYKGCTVLEEWKTFSNFKKWFDKHYVDNGSILNKDLKVKNAKVFSPRTCMFVPHEVNEVISPARKNKGFVSRNRNGYGATYRGFLGYFSTRELARDAIVLTKKKEIMQLCGKYPNLIKHLIKHI